MIEVNRGYLDHIRRWSRPSGLRGVGLLRRAVQLALVPFLLLLAVVLFVWLRVYVAMRSEVAASRLHEEAISHVETLTRQYPFHLYPIVAKALELAYVKPRIAERSGGGDGILEIAIGEGTLSARVFERSMRVTGLDLNPHSLVRATRMPHVERAVVGDGLNPPVRAGAFNVVLSLNFLHHVTDKGPTIARWARVGRLLIFNENTPFWASGWPAPYLLKRIGLGGAARRYADRIEARSLQHLVDRETLELEIAEVAPISEQASFLSERCFFLCGLFSALMLCYGPPTPPLLKSLFLGPLRLIALPLTAALAKLLLTFDGRQDRTSDTFLFFTCRGEPVTATVGSAFVCPRCGSELAATRCLGCGTVFPESDGMLFLLPAQFSYVFDDYTRHEGASIPAEHL
jgi:ubiquinone/menaquinone biosynthesis C-methylase UbiE